MTITWRFLSRPLHLVGYHHVLMICLAVAIVLESLVVSGCSSNSAFIPNIYTMRLSYGKEPSPSMLLLPANVVAALDAVIPSSDSLEVRVSYFGMCIVVNGSLTSCGSSSRLLGESDFLGESDPLNLIGQADRYRAQVLFPYLEIIAVIAALLAFGLLATFPGWHEEVDENGSERDLKPFPNGHVLFAIMILTSGAAMFSFSSILWQHSAAVAYTEALPTAFVGRVSGSIGAGAMALGWISALFNIIGAIGILIMGISIALLEREVDTASPPGGEPLANLGPSDEY